MLRHDPSRTVIRPFEPGYPAGHEADGRSRLQVIDDWVTGYDGGQVDRALKSVESSLQDSQTRRRSIALR
ncbi:hypothetical protein AB5T46_17380 [Luteimonas sp. C3_2_a3]